MFLYHNGDVDVMSVLMKQLNLLIISCTILGLGQSTILFSTKKGLGRDVMVFLFKLGIVDFFVVELVSVLGKLLNNDNQTLHKEMFDCARLLITTKIVKELNILEDIWVDGQKYLIQIVEDLEFGLVEDACMVEMRMIIN